MIVEAIGRAEQLSNLRPGQCFFFELGREMRFGMLTQDDNHRGFLVFAKLDDDRSPWIITGGLPQSMLVLDDVSIRPDWTSLAFGAAVELGAITSAGGDFYMRAALRKMETISVNVASGMVEGPPPLGPIFHYTSPPYS